MINNLNIYSQNAAESFTPDDSWGVISIRGGRRTVNLQPGWGARLDLVFNDIHKPMPGFIAFDKKHAESIIDWLDHNYEVGSLRKLAIHCEQGISRSQAVGFFVETYYARGRFAALKNASRYNVLVYKVLEEEYQSRNYQ